MMRECVHEHELLVALQASQWPACCTEDLKRHVAGCQVCLEVVALVMPLLDDRRDIMATAELPSSAVVWWRAQMRARQESVRQASRPLRLVEWVSFACAAGLLAVGVGYAGPMLTQWLAVVQGVAEALTVPRIGWTDVAQLGYPTIAMVAVVTLLVIIAPAAAYLTVREK